MICWSVQPSPSWMDSLLKYWYLIYTVSSRSRSFNGFPFNTKSTSWHSRSASNEFGDVIYEIVKNIQKSEIRSGSTYLIVCHVQYLQTGQFLCQAFQVVQQMNLVVTQIQCLQIGNIFGDYVYCCQHNRRPKQCTKYIFQIDVRVEFCQIQCFCCRRVTLRHRHFHFLFQICIDLHLWYIVPNADNHFETVR